MNDWDQLRDNWSPAIGAVIRRPDLWATALRQSVALAPRGWWRQWPPLPLPASDYLRFRMLTAYGDPDAAPKRHDVITWLEWSRSWKSVTSGPKSAGGNRSDLPTASH